VTAFKTGGIQLVSEAQIAEANKEHTYYIKNWQTLRRGCMEMVDTFSDFMDLKPKDFMKQLELETDEHHNVNLKAMKEAWM
jgi:hypothetical protein